jgi:hypothetical protein
MINKEDFNRNHRYLNQNLISNRLINLYISRNKNHRFQKHQKELLLKVDNKVLKNQFKKIKIKILVQLKILKVDKIQNKLVN